MVETSTFPINTSPVLPSTTSSSGGNNHTGTIAGAIAGGIVGGVIGSILIVLLVWVIRHRLAKQDTDSVNRNDVAYKDSGSTPAKGVPGGPALKDATSEGKDYSIIETHHLPLVDDYNAYSSSQMGALPSSTTNEDAKQLQNPISAPVVANTDTTGLSAVTTGHHRLDKDISLTEYSELPSDRLSLTHEEMPSDRISLTDEAMPGNS
jgi:hypothetical protein